MLHRPVIQPDNHRILGIGAILALALLGCSPDADAPDGTGGDASGTGGQGSGAGGATPSGGQPGTGGADPIPGGMVVGGTEVISKELRANLMAAEDMDGAGLLAAYAPPASEGLSFVPSTAEGMDLLQASALALSPGELAKLDEHGFVISREETFPSFAYGYKTIYSEDLPVYVSADSILEALHRSFDYWLKGTEYQVLMPELTALLSEMRAAIASSIADPQTATDVDLYLSVAQSLLEGSLVEPKAGGDGALAAELLAGINAADGHQEVTLFGVVRDVDFSQFKPRGHYTDSEELERYFRAMMWLGRIDFRLVETKSDGSQVFHRRQFDGSVALRSLMGDAQIARWRLIDGLIGVLIGEPDSMTVDQLGALMEALGVSSLTDALALDDEAITDELAAGGWGAQRIASRIIIKGDPGGQTLPLDRSFLLFGQRYTVDSHTFTNTTYDRVANRLMPKPLDVAFAALGNSSALPLLDADLNNASYAAGLAKTRVLVDAHEAEYWQSSVYTSWLSALSSLSPTEDEDLAGITPTDGWRRRMLNTQLGSWAQLRHDTILYVKQSYTTGVTCEFPDAYVDPYPEFYRKMGLSVEKLRDVANGLPSAYASFTSSVSAWSDLFTTVTGSLAEMADNQVSGTPHSGELLDFINDAVNFQEEFGCGGPPSYYDLSGWYFKLYPANLAIEADPVVADVHTQPTDEGGNDVGRILHVGTGSPRLMVVTAETCMGPRAYAGLAYSYGEHVTEDWLRLTDDEWAQYLAQNPFPDPAWIEPVLAE